MIDYVYCSPRMQTIARTEFSLIDFNSKTLILLTKGSLGEFR